MLLEFARGASAPIPTKPWHKLKAAPAPRAALRPQGQVRRDLPLPQGPRGEALQAVHPRLPAAVPAGQDLRRLRRQRGSTPTRWRCGSAATPSPRSPARSVDGIHEWLARARAHAVRARGRRISSWSSSTPGSSFLRDVGLGYLTLDRQTRTLSGRRGAADLARQRARLPAGGHAVRARRAVRRPASRATPTACSRCSAGCATAATRSSSSSTTSRRSSRPTSCSSSARAPASTAVAWCTPGRSPRRSHTLTGQYLTGQKRIAVPSARRPAGPAVAQGARRRRCTTSAAWTWTFRSARSRP